jgi:hypothetical protein
MHPRTEGSAHLGLPHAFVNRRGERLVIRRLDERMGSCLVEMYLAYQPAIMFDSITLRACWRSVPVSCM